MQNTHTYIYCIAVLKDTMYHNCVMVAATHTQTYLVYTYALLEILTMYEDSFFKKKSSIFSSFN